MAETLYEQYVPNPNNNYSRIYGTLKKGQGFTSSVNHTPTKINVQIGYSGTPPTTTYIELYAASSDLPTGSVLASGSIASTSFPAGTANTIAWTDITWSYVSPGFYIQAGVKYIIVIYTTNSGNTSNCINWRFTDDTTDYSGGKRCSYDGSAWSTLETDASFKEYGEPYTASLIQIFSNYYRKLVA